MKSIKSKKTRLITLGLILVLLISIGYAALTTNLQINGNATIKSQNWSVYFDNVQTTAGSVTANPMPTTSGTTTTSLKWTVNMNEPGQFYEFYVDVVNGGSIDAMIGDFYNTASSSLENVTSTMLEKFLKYTVTYNDGSPIEKYDLLPANSSDTLKIRLEFRTDINPEDLPGKAQQIELIYRSFYVQADNNAKARTVVKASSLAKLGKIKVGDYVNYTPSSGSVTINAAQSGIDGSQTFSTENDSGMTWRVLSVNNSTGEIKIVSTPTWDKIGLEGKAGFGNAESILNSIASIYGGGIGAASSRSITEDDIFDAIGYNKVANYVGDIYTYTSGEYFTENWNSTTGTATYSTTTTIATEENPVILHDTSHNQFDSNNEWVGGGINIASQTLENGTEAQKAEMQIYWDMLLNDSCDYWCVSHFVLCSPEEAFFFVRSVQCCFINSGFTLDYLYRVSAFDTGDEDSDYHSVVPVITLQPNIGMEQDNNNVWNFVQ